MADRLVGTLARPFVSVASWSRELQEADAAVRTPLALSRRVGVLAVEDGSGTSTVAAALAGLLAQRRRGAVLGVDAGGGGFRARLGVESDAHDLPDAEDDDAEDRRASLRASAQSAEEARQGLLEHPSGLQVLDLGRSGERWPAPVERWSGQVGPIARFYDLVVTDWGTRPWSADLSDAAATSHVAVLVARADRRSALQAAAGLSLVRAAGAHRALLVLVDVDATSDRLGPRLARQLEVPVTTLRHDPVLVRDLGLKSRRLSARTRLTFTRLGRAVVEQAALSALPERV